MITPRYQPLVIVLAPVAVGIALDRFCPLPIAAWWGLSLAAWAAWLILYRKRRYRSAALALLLAAGAAAAWHHDRWFLFDRDDLGFFAGVAAEPVCVEAVALSTPRPLPPLDFNPMRFSSSGEEVRFDVELTAIRAAEQWRPASGRAGITVRALLPAVRAGDHLRIFARLLAPDPPHNPGEFDRADFLRADRVRAQLSAKFAESVVRLQSGCRWAPRRLLENIRVEGNRILKRHLSPQRAGLAAAVLLGAREQLDPERTEAFMETGTVHLLVIAGLHLGILAGTLLLILRRTALPRRWTLAAVAGFSLSYMLVVDAHAPVLRATTLIVVMCVSMLFARRPSSFNSLAAAALIILALNPASLFQVGPQLSFLCVAGLMYFAPRWMHSSAEIDPLSRLIAENRGWMAKLLWLAGQSMRHFTLVSATMWLLTLPLVMARFHLCTPIAILLNTLIWLPMAAAVVSGLLTLLLGACCPPLACASAVVCNGSLWLLEWLVGVSRHVPLGHNWVPGPDDWWLAGFYGVLGLWLAFPRCRPPRRWRVALLAAWITAGLVGSWRLADPAHLRCTFLSVGHGGAAVVELPSRQVLLYDAGEFGAPSGAARTIAGFLWTRGITHIDAIVLSHADVDHYNAVPGLLDRFSVGAIYVSPVMFEDKNQAVSALLRAIRQSKTPIRVLSCGDRLCGGAQCRLKVLHPPDPGVLGTDNANSLVLLVEHLGHRILLTGDLEPPGLDDVLAEEPLDCDILAVPHHGSRRSDPVRLAAWSRPRWAVVSASRRWNLAPVEAIYRAAGAQVLETPDTGAITALLGAEGARVRCFFPFLAPCRAGGIAKQFKDSKL